MSGGFKKKVRLQRSRVFYSQSRTEGAADQRAVVVDGRPQPSFLSFFLTFLLNQLLGSRGNQTTQDTPSGRLVEIAKVKLREQFVLKNVFFDLVLILCQKVFSKIISFRRSFSYLLDFFPP